MINKVKNLEERKVVSKLLQGEKITPIYVIPHSDDIAKADLVDRSVFESKEEEKLFKKFDGLISIIQNQVS